MQQRQQGWVDEGDATLSAGAVTQAPAAHRHASSQPRPPMACPEGPPGADTLSLNIRGVVLVSVPLLLYYTCYTLLSA
jgi:hypothetical protein